MSVREIQTHAVGFHSGELAVQRRAGVQAQAARLEIMMGPGELRGGIAALLMHASFGAISARDRDGGLWISPMVGTPGFLEPTSPTTLSLHEAMAVGDPLYGLDGGQSVGIIVVEFAIKRRARINGTVTAADGGSLEVDVVQAYGNCPQYIHPRVVRPENATGATDIAAEHDDTLNDGDKALIRSVDTFFFGTSHPERGNDASHRGGDTGFVRVEGNTVSWPDYAGNNMFNSMGNLEIDPSAALLFVDFASGRTLQLSGTAVVEWGEPAAPGDTGRRVRFSVERVVRSKRKFRAG